MKNDKILSKKWFTYIVLSVILFISFLLSYYSSNEVLKNIATIPGIGALVLALYKSWKDEQLQNKQQDFILATSSHIAEVAYDKHVLFCEQYIERIQKGRQELFQEGPSPQAMSIGADLVRIRQKHSAWLTDEIENNLKPFEQILIKIGSNEHYLQMTAGESMNDKKKKIIEDIYRSFGLVVGHEIPKNDQETDLHIDKVVDKIRDILGIKTITKLRIRATKVALDRLN